MNVFEYLFDVIIAFVLFFVIDQVWLSLVTRNYYLEQYAHVQNSPVKVRLYSAVMSYGLAAIGLVLFVIPHLKQAKKLEYAVLLGSLYGLILYGFYDTNNHSVLSRWTHQFALMDIVWGAFLAGLVTSLIYMARHA